MIKFHDYVICAPVPDTFSEDPFTYSGYPEHHDVIKHDKLACWVGKLLNLCGTMMSEQALFKTLYYVSVLQLLVSYAWPLIS